MKYKNKHWKDFPTLPTIYHGSHLEMIFFSLFILYVRIKYL